MLILSADFILVRLTLMLVGCPIVGGQLNEHRIGQQHPQTTAAMKDR